VQRGGDSSRARADNDEIKEVCVGHVPFGVGILTCSKN
jgi:hypothetical protein